MCLEHLATDAIPFSAGRFYLVAAKAAGLTLSQYENESLEKVLSVTIAAGQDEGAVNEGTELMEQEDLTHGASLQELIAREQEREEREKQKMCCLC